MQKFHHRKKQADCEGAHASLVVDAVKGLRPETITVKVTIISSNKAQVDRGFVKQAIAKTTSIRQNEASEFGKHKAEAESNVAAIAKAITAIDAGMSGFLQTNSALVLHTFLRTTTAIPYDRRQEILSFASSDGADYAPRSGEISGICEDNQGRNGKWVHRSECDREIFDRGLQRFDGSEKERNCCAYELHRKKALREGEAAVEFANMKNDLSETGVALEEDRRFLSDLEGNCANNRA